MFSFLCQLMLHELGYEEWVQVERKCQTFPYLNIKILVCVQYLCMDSVTCCKHLFVFYALSYT